MKKLYTFLIFNFSFLVGTFAQVDMGIPSITGKGGAANGVVKDWECIGVNPANLGWKQNYGFSISGLIVGASVQSRALNYKQLKNAIMHSSDTFSRADKKLFASLFTCRDGLNMQGNIDWLTFSFRIPKVGGFAMNIRDRTFAHVTLNKNAADILFNGMNAEIFKNPLAIKDSISTIFDGTKASYMHYREMNFAYGAKLFGIGGTKDSSAVSFYGGVGFKYLWGLGNFETIIEDGIFTAHSALSTKSGVDYGNIKNFTPQSSSGVFPAVGRGSAFDVGIGVGMGKMKITFSAIDMGKITWDKNVLVAQNALLPDTSKINFEGIDSWSLTEQGPGMFNDSGIVHFKPGPAYSTPMLSKFRLGLGYEFSKRFVMGADVVLPMSNNPSNLENAFFALGTEFELATDLAFSVGLAGNSNYGLSVPFGVKLGHFFRIMEVRVATNDVLTYLSPGKNPIVSVCISLFRFNFDRKEK